MTPLVRVPGPRGSLAADEGGEGGPPVLFLHSLAGTRHHWDAQLRHLRSGRRAVALDLPGHGSSGPLPGEPVSSGDLASVVASACDALELDRFVLVGHSFGGGVAQALAGRLAGRVAGLVLADPVGDHRDEREEIGGFLARLRTDAYREVVAGFWEEILEGAEDDTRERVLADLRATPPETVIRGMEALASHDPAAALAPYDGPVLVVRNPRFDEPSALHRVIPQLPTVELGGASHWFQMDRPGAFNGVLDDFLERVEGRAGG